MIDAPESDRVGELWSLARPDDRGLVSAVVQHAQTHQVLMLGFMNRAALEATWAHRRVTFWSRSKGRLWEKGEESGNTLDLVDVRLDCDGDALLVRAVPRGPTCHTGTTSCFFRHLDGEHAQLRTDDGPPAPAMAMFERVFGVILQRKAGSEGKSYVRHLLAQGLPTVAAKIAEEAEELGRAVTGESDERVASEAADLIFHAFVGLAARDLDPVAVADVLAQRFGVSGLDEKARRQSP